METPVGKHGFAIIGCGMIAEFHTRAINKIPGARVAAAYSRTQANAEKIARIARGQCQVYDDLETMLAQPDVDVVCICTPSGAHMEPAVRSTLAG
ncbi:MAG: Gfo/Idh/MocA family oxidoreductase, partial [Planctomycetaceae bacterium]|nr:Gfo/Idh/MocA family oxidoreductase [Planctomycetaceae bacterium]